jgi:ubiquinone/menaquinone biosynthesis C-methylase UbiE
MKENYLKVNYTSRKQNTSYDRKLIAHLFSRLKQAPREGNKILDLACGTGAYKEMFDDFGLVYYGIDIDNDVPSLQIVKGDIGNKRFPYDDAMFEYVFFKMGIEHLTIGEIARCLGEVRRVLKPGGEAIVLTPDWTWMYRVFYTEYTHQTPFTTSSLRTAIEMNGLRCTHSQTLIQLPIVWKIPVMKYFCDVIQVLYPFLSTRVKFVKYSRDRILFAIAMKES